MSLKIEYDPCLVEQTVNHVASTNPKFELELHRRTDPLYDFPPSADRDEKFLETHGALFEKLGLGRILPRLLGERPVISESVRACLVCPALRPTQESAELHVRTGAGGTTAEDRTLILQVSVPTMAEPEHFARRMRPELLHIADMLDPGFRYRRQQIDGLPSRQNLIRDRYRVLWEIYVRGRLEREGHGGGARRSGLLDSLGRVFGIDSRTAATRAFARVFDAPSLTHEQLFAWANVPGDLCEPEGGPRRVETGKPGANCPLCGFSTFDWFVFDGGSQYVVSAIEDRHPDWTPECGACRQCVEIYASGAAVAPQQRRSHHAG